MTSPTLAPLHRRWLAGLRALLGLLLGLALPARAATYVADDSAINSTLFPWIDISSTGTGLNLGDNGISATLAMGFSFTFGGTSYSNVRIMSNGQVQFGGSITNATNSNFPLDGNGGRANVDLVMLPLWDDLNPGSGDIRYRMQGTAPNRVFIVSWNSVDFTNSSYFVCDLWLIVCLAGHWTTPTTATFQVQIYEQGYFVYRYGAVDGNGGTHTGSGSYTNPAGATIGVEVSDSDYTLYSYHSASISNGAVIVWTALPSPTLKMQFNETSWSGTTGEVTDGSTNAYHGTAAGLSATKPGTRVTTPVISGATGTCAYGKFNRANKDYVALPAGFPNLGAASANYTITAWIRTSDNTQPGQRIFIVDEHNTGGYSLSLGDGGTGKLRWLTRGLASSVSLDTGAVISNNTWYFVAAGVNFDTKYKFLFVYDASGTQVAAVTATFTESVSGSDSGIATIGGESNASTEATSSFGFSGAIDEVRVYPAALTDANLQAVLAQTSTCPAYLLARYRLEESSWNGTAGELTDSAGYGDGPYHGNAQGSPLASAASASPARSGSPGTCGYASLPGPAAGGGNFVVTGLPLPSASGAQTSVSFWMYWTGTGNVMPLSFNQYDLFFSGTGSFGFNTDNADLYGIATTGLANGWHHVVAVFTNGGVAGNLLYIDGVAQTLTQRTGTPSAANAVTGTTLRIGGYGTTTNYRFVGRIDEVQVYSGALSAGQVATLYAETHTCAVTVDHLAITAGSASGLTCTPTTFTVTACTDAACSSAYTGGITGSLSLTGASMTVNYPSGAGFTIAAGSSSTTVSAQVTTVGSVTVSASGLSITPNNAQAVFCGLGVAAASGNSCSFSAADSGLLFDVPNHVADVSQTVSVSAVKKADSSLACTPAFASVSKNVTFKCSYTNPTTGTLPVRVGGAALNASNSTSAACDPGGRAVSLSFNASGVASTTVQYADVGQVLLTGTYSGSGSDAGLTMTGTDSFVAAPSAFAIGSITAAPIRAGASFSATVTAQNASAAATPNFGKETSPEGATLTFTKRSPTGAGAATGTFSGSLGAFSAGAATASNLAYTEVGTGDLTATLTSGSYLGSGLTATGTTGSGGAVGRFMPHHFDVTVTPACAAGSFTYAGQPFGATVTARNAAGGTTLNYDGSASTSPNYAKAVTLSEPSALGVGTLSGTAIAAAGFTAGVGSGSPTYTYTTKQTGTRTLGLRAVDTDSVSSSGYTEGSTGLRSGRLRLSSAFGSASATLSVPVTAEYWSGNAWVLNSADSCTALAGANVAVSNARNALGNASAATTSAGAVSLVNGQGNIVLAAPSPAGSSVGYDLALNLGSTSADQSCQASHPATTGAAKAWLRSANGSCSALWDRDPAARASFGIFSPETRKAVRMRELF